MMKFLGTCLTVIFLFSCTGTQPAVTNQVSARKITAGYSVNYTDTDWRQAQIDSIKKAADEAGVELIFNDAHWEQELQIRAIRSFIERKVDIIVLTPVVADGFGPVLQEAKAARIPLICIDYPVVVDDASLYVTCIGNDWYGEGKTAGQWLITYLTHHGMMEREIRIAEIQGTIDSGPQIERGNGFKEIISQYPNINIIRSQSGDFTRAGGKEVMEAFLREEGNHIDVVYTHNDTMVLGAIQSIEEYGLKPGQDIIIVSIDGIREAFEALIAGRLNCTVECSPDAGPRLMETVKAVLSGEDVPKFIGTKDGIFTTENAAAELPHRRY
jgi:ABC-type sugar transport system substrate-binding protein